MSTSRSTLRIAAPAVAAGLCCWGLLAPVAQAATSRFNDFDGDAHRDLVVSAPGGTVGGRPGAGYVVVMWGSSDGFSPVRRTVISRATAGIPGTARAGEGFGTYVSTGDLDADGYADLVIGAARGNGGSVILWGGPHGLGGAVAIPGSTTVSSTGDYNGDTRTDLVLIQSGGPAGSPASRPAGGHQARSRAIVWNNPVSREGRPSSTRAFGSATAARSHVTDAVTGDVNGDGVDDLALIEDRGAGHYAVEMFLATEGADLGSGTDVTAVAGATTGMDLGDVNDDGHDDLVIGDASAGAGTVVVAYGSPSGLTPSSQWTSIDQNTPGVPGVNEAGDRFGAALSVLPTTGSGICDVVVGAPGESVGSVQRAGDVVVLRGSKHPLSGAGAVGFSQNTKGIPGGAETGDEFGGSVEVLPVSPPEIQDLYAAAPGENGGEGVVWALHNNGGKGLTAAGSGLFGPHAVGVAAKDAAFGAALH
jgi:hypothetical protein